MEHLATVLKKKKTKNNNSLTINSADYFDKKLNIIQFKEMFKITAWGGKIKPNLCQFYCF